MKELNLKVISTNLTDREITLEYQGSAWFSKGHLMYRENSEPFALISVKTTDQHCTIERKYKDYHMKMELVQDALSVCSITTPEGVMQLNVKMKLLKMTKYQICLEYDLYSFGQVVDQFRKVFTMEG